MRRSLLFSLLALTLALGACTKEKNGGKKLGEITRETLVQKISITGTVRGLRQTEVQAGYAGYVGKIYVSVGDKVKEGQELVRITQTINQPLNEVYPIRAPFAGTVTQVLKREGEYLAQGSSGSTTGQIMVISDLTELWIDATVPEVDIAKISLGLEASIRANALPNKIYKGKVERLSLSPKQSADRWDRGRVEYPTEIRITDADEKLRPGMTVVIDVISAKAENALTVRHEYVRKDKDGFFLIGENGEPMRIEVGISNEEAVEIRSGAEEGTKVEMTDFSRDDKSNRSKRR